MNDISDLASVSPSTPETAAQNIEHGNLFSLNPTYVAQNKQVFDEQAGRFPAEVKAEEPVAGYMGQSTEHAALAKPDVEHLNFMARQTKAIGDYMFDRPNVQQRIVDLTLKKINQGGKLSDEDEIQLIGANQDAADLENKDYGMTGPIEKIPAIIAGGLSDLGQSIVRGARKGIMEGPLPGGSMDSLTANLAYGVMVKDPYDTLTAGMYNELSNMTDEKGNPKNFSHEDKVAISRAVGVIGTTLMNTGGYLVAESAPFLKPFVNTSLMRGIINTPGRAAMLIGLGNIIKGAAAVGGASGLTEVAKVVGEEYALNKGTDEAGLWNSIASATQKLDKYGPRIAEATGTGALMGATLELPLQIAGFGRTKQMFSEGFKNYVETLPPERDVTPEAQKLLRGAEEPKKGNVTDIGVTDAVDHWEREMSRESGTHDSPTDESIKALQMNEALHQINDVQKATGMSDLAPGELKEVNRRNFVQAGLDKLYSTLDFLREWATSEAKGKAARNIIDKSGVAAGQMNAPLELDSHEVMNIAKTYPDILDHVSHAPGAPTGMQAKHFVEALQAAEVARAQLMGKLGIKPEDVVPEEGTNVTKLEVPEAGPKVKPDLEGAARRTGELIKQKQETEQRFAAWEKTQEEYAKSGEPIPLEQKSIAKEIKDTHEKSIAKIEKELEKLKAEVTGHLKENPPGSLLMFPAENEAGRATKAEMSFGREPTFSEALKTVLPEKEVKAFDEAVLRARMNVVDVVHDAAVHEMNKVVDQTAAIAKEEQFRAEMDRIAHDPNYAIVDKFHRDQVANAKGKAKHSVYAIDPVSLPNDLLHFTENPRLKKHKVFAKGALSADDSARALGFNSPREMLETFAKTPTREEVLKARSKAYDSDIEKLARESVDLDHTTIANVFTDKTKAYLETMRFLKDNDWSKTKFGIKKVALPLPRIEEIEHDAKESVKKMTVSQLKPSLYAIGERQSNRNAVMKFLAGDIAGAFREKELAARNAAMQKEVRKAIGAMNRAQKFARRLEDPTAQSIIKAAGPTLQNAMDEILDVYNLNPNKKNQAKKDSFAKWVKREFDAGRGNFVIPDHLTDIRKGIGDMTVEQVTAAEDRLRALFAEASYKTELMRSHVLREEQRNIDRIAEKFQQIADEHPSSGKGDDLPPIQDPVFLGERLVHAIQAAPTVISTMEHTVRFYDKGMMNGFVQQTIVHPLKGDGQWNHISGGSKEHAMMSKMAKEIKKIKEVHGNYDNVEKELLYVEELKDFKSFRNGHLTRGDLMTMWAFKGDPDGRDRLLNNHLDSNGKGLTLERLEKILDKHLEERDVTAMQYGVDMYKQYEDETRDLQMRRKGEQVVFVKGLPNKWKDKVFPGGYVKLQYAEDWSAAKASESLKAMKEQKAAWFENTSADFYRNQAAAEQTEQGRLITRTGSNSPLDLSLLRFWRGHEEVINDLSYWEPVTNALKLLKDKRIREAMIRMGGKAKYDLVVDTVIELAGKTKAMNANYFSDQNRFIKDLSAIAQNNFNIGVLGLNLFTSTPIQLSALGSLTLNMGVRGFKHLVWTNSKMLVTPHLWNSYLNFASEIDPTIGHFMEQLQNSVDSTIHSLIPRKGWRTRVPGATLTGRAREWAVNTMFAPMSVADVVLKVMGATASYSQFMAGDAPNFPIERVSQMTPQEKHDAAIAYARQISRLSLTHGKPEDKAPFQKSPLGYFFANYWNDGRNTINNIMMQSRKIGWNTKDAVKSITGGGGGKPPPGAPTRFEEMRDGGEGRGSSFDYTAPEPGRAFKSAMLASGSIMSMVVIYSLMRWWQDKLRGIQQTPGQMRWDLTTPEGIQAAAKQAFSYMAFSPIDQALSEIPVVKDMFFVEQMPDRVIRGWVDKVKNVQIPVIKQLSDFATAANTITDAVDQADNLSSFLFYLTHLSNTETGALMRTATNLGIPFPENAYAKMMRLLDLPLNSPTYAPKTAFEKLDHAITTVLERHAMNGEHHIELDPKDVAELKDIQKQIAPKVVEVPSNATDKIKLAMSGGNWAAPNGIYGFSKDQWAEIKLAAPDLGLTDSGRIAKDTGQQEKAMDFLLHYNAEKLAEKQIRVNNESLYGAYRLGLEEYEKLYKAPADAKLKVVLSESTMKENPDLAASKTVGQAKQKLTEELSKGQGIPTAQLTE